MHSVQVFTCIHWEIQSEELLVQILQQENSLVGEFEHLFIFWSCFYITLEHYVLSFFPNV